MENIESKLVEQFENEILNWLNGENENATYIAAILVEIAKQEFLKLNKPAVSVVREPLASGAVCPHFDTCQNGGKNEYCDLQTFKEIDCFVGQTER